MKHSHQTDPTPAERAAGFRPYDKRTRLCAINPDHGPAAINLVWHGHPYSGRGWVCWDCSERA